MRLKLLNADDNQEIEIEVSEEEYEKAQTDMDFASALVTRALNEKESEQDASEGTAEMAELSNSYEECQYRWCNAAVLLLLASYKESYDKLILTGKISQKAIYADVASILQNKGYSVTPDQCKSKITALKRQYKVVKNHNKSGKRKSWVFYNIMEKTFGNNIWGDSKSSAFEEPSSSLPTDMNDANRKEKVIVDIMLQLRQDRIKQRAERHLQLKEKMESKSGKQKKLLDILIKLREDRVKLREDRERQHRERMESKEKMIDLLRGILEACKKK